jgi:hypothetical protein
LEAVREAIAYCESNPPEIQEDWESEEASILARAKEKAESQPPSQPSQLTAQPLAHRAHAS